MVEGSGLVFPHIETKNFDWFYDDQLERHLDALAADGGGGTKALVALGNFEALAEDRFEAVERICAETYGGRIFFAAVSFEDFVGALPQEKVSKNLADTVEDFEGYLDEMGLLPRWKHRLDVVNCGRSYGEITRENVYLCPAKGGAYNHSRARFFGAYQGKTVRRVALIEAVVDLGDGDPALGWRTSRRGTPSCWLVPERSARSCARAPTPSESSCSAPFRRPTSGSRSRGGMQTSKRYFDVERLHAADAVVLAEKLRGKTWASY
jgi:hypothetical protein